MFEPNGAPTRQLFVPNTPEDALLSIEKPLCSRVNRRSARVGCVAVIPSTRAKREALGPRYSSINEKFVVVIDDLGDPISYFDTVSMNDVIGEARSLAITRYALRANRGGQTCLRIEHAVVVRMERRTGIRERSGSSEKTVVQAFARHTEPHDVLDCEEDRETPTPLGGQASPLFHRIQPVVKCVGREKPRSRS